MVAMAQGELGNNFIWGIVLLLIAVVAEVGHASITKSLAFSLWVSTIKNLGVAKSSIFSALIPVAAALIAWSLGHEILNSRQWIGIAVSTFGVILSQYTKPARSQG